MQLVTPNNKHNEPISLSIIVPVYNEEQMLPIFHHQLLKVVSAIQHETFEVIYINDGSSDNSWDVMRALSASMMNIECINLSRNFGKEAALTAGIDHAKGQAIVLLDADLQDPPELIPDMLKAWRNGFDIVNMKREARLGESKLKRYSAHLYYRVLQFLSDVPLQRDVGDFRLIDRRVVEKIKLINERNRYMKGILSWPGYKHTTLSFDRPKRNTGTSKWSFLQLAMLGLSGITAFSVKPLRLSTWAGVIVSISAFSYAIWIVIKTMVFGEPVPGYPTLILMQLFLGGMQLLAIGILGEYVGRIFAEVKARPIYLVMDVECKKQNQMLAQKHA